MMYLSTVNVIAKAWLLKGCVSSGIWPVFGSTPKTSPVKRGIMQTQSVIRRTAYVQKNMHLCPVWRVTLVLGQLIDTHPEGQEE